MKNTQEAKDLLLKALSRTPEDFALGEVRTHIRLALNKLEHVEKKRERRMQLPPPVVVNPVATRQTIEFIDDMIEQEKVKIENIKKRKTSEDEGTLNG